MSDCIVWDKHIDKWGYGRRTWQGRPGRLAHRVAYEEAYGPIPEGLVLDHLCRNPPCVNPEHLEAVTQGENMRRCGNAVKTHCPQGHPYEGNSTLWQGHRHCRTCRRAYDAKRYAKRKEVDRV